MDQSSLPFYRDEEALRGLIALCGQDLYGRSLLRTGDERIAKALSRRVLLRLAELDRNTPLRYCRLLADAYLEQTLSEWELAMLQNSIRTGRIEGVSREGIPAPARETGAAPGGADPDACADALAEETLFPRSGRKRRKARPAPERPLPDEEDAFEEVEEGHTPVWLVLLLTVLCVVLLWFALGLFMRMGALPFIDLGYRFFNARVLPLF